MRRNAVEYRLNMALERACPDVLERVLERMPEAAPPVPVPSRPARRPRALRYALAAAALVAVLGGSLFAGGNLSVHAVLALDVNPGIEMTLNRHDRVLRARAVNAEAEAVLGDMDLRGTDADVAVNALVGAMVRSGYLTAESNAVLVSVVSKDAPAAQALRARVALVADEALRQNAVEGAVVSQGLRATNDLTQISQAGGTSQGKAALIQALIAQNPALTFDALKDVAVRDLALILQSKAAAPEGVAVTGTASRAGYLDEGAAIGLALAHAGLEQSAVRSICVEMDIDDGLMVYEVEFLFGDIEHEYALDAHTGDVVEWELEWKKRR